MALIQQLPASGFSCSTCCLSKTLRSLLWYRRVPYGVLTEVEGFDLFVDGLEFATYRKRERWRIVWSCWIQRRLLWVFFLVSSCFKEGGALDWRSAECLSQRRIALKRSGLLGPLSGMMRNQQGDLLLLHPTTSPRDFHVTEYYPFRFYAVTSNVVQHTIKVL